MQLHVFMLFKYLICLHSVLAQMSRDCKEEAELDQTSSAVRFRPDKHSAYEGVEKLHC